jgi:hypothetical protein
MVILGRIGIDDDEVVKTQANARWERSLSLQHTLLDTGSFNAAQLQEQREEELPSYKAAADPTLRKWIEEDAKADATTNSRLMSRQAESSPPPEAGLWGERKRYQPSRQGESEVPGPSAQRHPQFDPQIEDAIQRRVVARASPQSVWGYTLTPHQMAATAMRFAERGLQLSCWQHVLSLSTRRKGPLAINTDGRANQYAPLRVCRLCFELHEAEVRLSEAASALADLMAVPELGAEDMKPPPLQSLTTLNASNQTVVMEGGDVELHTTARGSKRPTSAPPRRRPAGSPKRTPAAPPARPVSAAGKGREWRPPTISIDSPSLERETRRGFGAAPRASMIITPGQLIGADMLKNRARGTRSEGMSPPAALSSVPTVSLDDDADELNATLADAAAAAAVGRSRGTGLGGAHAGRPSLMQLLHSPSAAPTFRSPDTGFTPDDPVAHARVNMLARYREQRNQQQQQQRKSLSPPRPLSDRTAPDTTPLTAPGPSPALAKVLSLWKKPSKLQDRLLQAAKQFRALHTVPPGSLVRVSVAELAKSTRVYRLCLFFRHLQKEGTALMSAVADAVKANSEANEFSKSRRAKVKDSIRVEIEQRARPGNRASIASSTPVEDKSDEESISDGSVSSSAEPPAAESKRLSSEQLAERKALAELSPLGKWKHAEIRYKLLDVEHRVPVRVASRRVCQGGVVLIAQARAHVFATTPDSLLTMLSGQSMAVKLVGVRLRTVAFASSGRPVAIRRGGRFVPLGVPKGWVSRRHRSHKHRGAGDDDMSASFHSDASPSSSFRSSRAGLRSRPHSANSIRVEASPAYPARRASADVPRRVPPTDVTEPLGPPLPPNGLDTVMSTIFEDSKTPRAALLGTGEILRIRSRPRSHSTGSRAVERSTESSPLVRAERPQSGQRGRLSRVASIMMDNRNAPPLRGLQVFQPDIWSSIRELDRVRRPDSSVGSDAGSSDADPPIRALDLTVPPSEPPLSVRDGDLPDASDPLRSTVSAMERVAEAKRKVHEKIVRQQRPLGPQLVLRKVVMEEQVLALGTIRFGSFLAVGKGLSLAKRDDVVPMVTSDGSLGSLGLAIGMAIVCDGQARSLLAASNTVRTRGNGVFWPREDFVLARPIPAQWLSGLPLVPAKVVPAIARILREAASGEHAEPEAPASLDQLVAAAMRPSMSLPELSPAASMQAKRRWKTLKQALAFHSLRERGGSTALVQGSIKAERARARRVLLYALPQLSRRAKLSTQVPLVGVGGLGMRSIEAVPRLKAMAMRARALVSRRASKEEATPTATEEESLSDMSDTSSDSVPLEAGSKRFQLSPVLAIAGFSEATVGALDAPTDELLSSSDDEQPWDAEFLETVQPKTTEPGHVITAGAATMESHMWIKRALTSPSALFGEWAGMTSYHTMKKHGLRLGKPTRQALRMPRRLQGERSDSASSSSRASSSGSSTRSSRDSSQWKQSDRAGTVPPGGAYGWLKQAYIRRSAKDAQLGPTTQAAASVALGSADVLPTNVQVDLLMRDIWRRDRRMQRELRHRRRRLLRRKRDEEQEKQRQEAKEQASAAAAATGDAVVPKLPLGGIVSAEVKPSGSSLTVAKRRMTGLFGNRRFGTMSPVPGKVKLPSLSEAPSQGEPSLAEESELSEPLAAGESQHLPDTARKEQHPRASRAHRKTSDWWASLRANISLGAFRDGVGVAQDAPETWRVASIALQCDWMPPVKQGGASSPDKSRAKSALPQRGGGGRRGSIVGRARARRASLSGAPTVTAPAVSPAPSPRTTAGKPAMSGLFASAVRALTDRRKDAEDEGPSEYADIDVPTSSTSVSLISTDDELSSVESVGPAAQESRSVQDARAPFMGWHGGENPLSAPAQRSDADPSPTSDETARPSAAARFVPNIRVALPESPLSASGTPAGRAPWSSPIAHGPRAKAHRSSLIPSPSPSGTVSSAAARVTRLHSSPEPATPGARQTPTAHPSTSRASWGTSTARGFAEIVNGVLVVNRAVQARSPSWSPGMRRAMEEEVEEPPTPMQRALEATGLPNRPSVMGPEVTPHGARMRSTSQAELLLPKSRTSSMGDVDEASRRDSQSLVKYHVTLAASARRMYSPERFSSSPTNDDATRVPSNDDESDHVSVTDPSLRASRLAGGPKPPKRKKRTVRDARLALLKRTEQESAMASALGSITWVQLLTRLQQSVTALGSADGEREHVTSRQLIIRALLGYCLPPHRSGAAWMGHNKQTNDLGRIVAVDESMSPQANTPALSSILSTAVSKVVPGLESEAQLSAGHGRNLANVLPRCPRHPLAPFFSGITSRGYYAGLPRPRADRGDHSGDGRVACSLPTGSLFVPLPGVVPDSDRRMRRRARLFRQLFRAVDPEATGWCDVGELRSRVLQEALLYEANYQVAMQEPPRRQRGYRRASRASVSEWSIEAAADRFPEKQWPCTSRRRVRDIAVVGEPSDNDSSEESMHTATSSCSDNDSKKTRRRGGGSSSHPPVDTVIEEEEDDEERENKSDSDSYERDDFEQTPQARPALMIHVPAKSPLIGPTARVSALRAERWTRRRLRYLCSEFMVRAFMATWLLADEGIVKLFETYESSATGRVSEADWVAMGHAAFAAFSEPGHPLSRAVLGWRELPAPSRAMKSQEAVHPDGGQLCWVFALDRYPCRQLLRDCLRQRRRLIRRRQEHGRQGFRARLLHSAPLAPLAAAMLSGSVGGVEDGGSIRTDMASRGPMANLRKRFFETAWSPLVSQGHPRRRTAPVERARRIRRSLLRVSVRSADGGAKRAPPPPPPRASPELPSPSTPKRFQSVSLWHHIPKPPRPRLVREPVSSSSPTASLGRTEADSQLHFSLSTSSSAASPEAASFVASPVSIQEPEDTAPPGKQVSPPVEAKALTSLAGAPVLASRRAMQQGKKRAGPDPRWDNLSKGRNADGKKRLPRSAALTEMIQAAAEGRLGDVVEAARVQAGIAIPPSRVTPRAWEMVDEEEERARRAAMAAAARAERLERAVLASRPRTSRDVLPGIKRHPRLAESPLAPRSRKELPAIPSAPAGLPSLRPRSATRKH